MPMKKSSYNIEDEQFKEVIESLKQLPRVDAPPDFEMNLKRRINNLKYAEKEKKGFLYYFSFKRPLLPAAALTACAVVAFLLISQQPETENPFIKVPPQRSAPTARSEKNNNNLKGHLIDPGSISSTDVVIKKQAPRSSSSKAASQGNINLQQPRNGEQGQIASNQRPSRRFRDLDFSGFGSDLDKNLRAKPDPNGGQDYGNPGANVNFGGFNLVPGPDNELDLLRARMDSLKRLWLRNNR